MSKIFFAALGIAGLSAIGASAPAQATPVPSSVASIGGAVAVQTTDVQYRRWHGGGRGWRGGYYRRGYYGGGWGWGGFGAGVAAGALVGAAVAAPYYYGGYGPGYYSGPPAVSAPGPAPRGSCWIATDTVHGYGYWGAC
jgi:hypothetical protein